MTFDPYCGPAPAPDALLWAWNLDPALLAALALLGGLAAVGAPATARTRLALAGAMAVLVLAFVSPLCALATALFSARVVHHVLLVAAAAPLLALAVPSWRLPWRMPVSVPVVVHATAMWFWHAPAPYGWALTGPAPYWIMELTLALSAFWLWSEVFRADRPAGPALAALLGTVVQMGLLGALITFAREPLYMAHALSTWPFGLSPMSDQQAAGVLMWVPGAAPYLVAAFVRLMAVLPADAATRGRGT